MSARDCAPQYGPSASAGLTAAIRALGFDARGRVTEAGRTGRVLRNGGFLKRVMRGRH